VAMHSSQPSSVEPFSLSLRITLSPFKKSIC
jgi:hypothetical protein